MILSKYTSIQPMGKLIRLDFVLILLFLIHLSSCDREETKDVKTAGFSLQMKSMSASLMNNTQLFVFNNPDKKFIRKQLNISKSENVLTTTMEQGAWNLILVSGEINIANQIILPPYGGNIRDYAMWKTPLDNTGNFLEQTPEIRYATIFPALIVEGQKTTENASLYRNVTKIQVILEDYSGFEAIDTEHPMAYAELLEVPTTIMWDGCLSTAPVDISDKPLRQYLQFDEENIADTLNFIVPGHKSTDTIPHKLKLKMSMPIDGKAYHGKTPVDISFTPKANTIIRVFVTFRGEPDAYLNIRVAVKDWMDTPIQTEVFD